MGLLSIFSSKAMGIHGHVVLPAAQVLPAGDLPAPLPPRQHQRGRGLHPALRVQRGHVPADPAEQRGARAGVRALPPHRLRPPQLVGALPDGAAAGAVQRDPHPEPAGLLRGARLRRPRLRQDSPDSVYGQHVGDVLGVLPPALRPEPGPRAHVRRDQEPGARAPRRAARRRLPRQRQAGPRGPGRRAHAPALHPGVRVGDVLLPGDGRGPGDARPACGRGDHAGGPRAPLRRRGRQTFWAHFLDGDIGANG
mmetsp:Transcript_32900/g.57216  ORF Transcript_32900/g.57216 Transcript_32900/m.57216 type:complete len:252 (-) Transcript_32900:367-1122(-)